MIRLDLNPAPKWVDMPAGVRLLCRPITTAVLQAGYMAMLPAETGEAPNGDVSAAVTAARQEDVLRKAVGRAVIADWDGVVDANGVKAVVSAQHIDAVMDHPAIGMAFTQRVIVVAQALQRTLAGEASGSASVPSGTTAAEPDTAENAETPVSPAPPEAQGQTENAALIKKTRPKP